MTDALSLSGDESERFQFAQNNLKIVFRMVEVRFCGNYQGITRS